VASKGRRLTASMTLPVTKVCAFAIIQKQKSEVSKSKIFVIGFDWQLHRYYKYEILFSLDLQS